MASEHTHTRVFSAPREQDPRDGETRAHRRVLRLVTVGCAGVASLGAVIGLVGWLTDTPVLERLGPGLATMKVNTALALLLLAIAIALPSAVALTSQRRSQDVTSSAPPDTSPDTSPRTTPDTTAADAPGAVTRAVVAVCAVVAGALAALQLLEYALHRDLGVDNLLVTDHGHGRHPGRSSIAAATCLLILAVCSLLNGPGTTSRRLRQGLALVAAAVSGLALLGYAYDVHSLYALEPYSSVALHSAIGLTALSVAVLTSTQSGAVSWALFGRDAGATLTRRLGPTAFVGLPVIGLACVVADRVGWLDGITTVALTVVLCTVAFGLATWVSGVRIARVDSERQRNLQDLTDLKQTLERQVSARADQLRSRHDEIAVLEDRQRIAADIHDVVIQRLFAAGMFLHGTPATDPETQQRIDTAIESMDTAIKELRASIFELGGHGARQLDIATALDDVCTDAARVLGFRPDLIVDDPDHEAETVRDDLLAVARESLSNVARHAAAGAVDITLRSGNGLISLTVTDDGRGMTRAPHSSGTRNMAERARQKGGDCVWTTVEPHGTRVWWHVPGAPVDLTAEPAQHIAAGG